MNWSIIIHIALALQGLQAGTILQEDRGLSDLKCNRYFLAGFIEVDWEKEFQPFAATRGIKDICKTIKNSCCSLEEMTHFRDVYREKKQIIRENYLNDKIKDTRPKITDYYNKIVKYISIK